jgi:hypothetical protein
MSSGLPQISGISGFGFKVARHPSIDDIAEMALEDAHGLLLRVPSVAGFVVAALTENRVF